VRSGIPEFSDLLGNARGRRGVAAGPSAQVHALPRDRLPVCRGVGAPLTSGRRRCGSPRTRAPGRGRRRGA
jgi:hypothetical protein